MPAAPRTCTYDYTDWADAPPAHRDVIKLHFAGASVEEISRLSGRGDQTIRRMLNHPPMVEYLAHLQHESMTGSTQNLAIVDEALGVLLRWALVAASDPDTPPTLKRDLLREFMDRHPDGHLMKQTRQDINVRKVEVYGADEIKLLKRRALEDRSGMIEMKPGSVELVEAKEEETAGAPC